MRTCFRLTSALYYNILWWRANKLTRRDSV